MSERSTGLVLTADLPIKDFIEQIIAELEKTTINFSRIGFGTWSHSKLKTFSSCYLLFLLKNVLKVEYTPTTSELERLSSLTMKYMGLVAHSILEDMLKGLSFDDSYLKAKSKNPEYFDEAGWGEVYTLKDRLEMFKDRFDFFADAHNMTSFQTEQKLAIDVDHNPVHFNSKNAFFRGVLDLSMTLENREVILFDHKNGGSAEHGLRNYEAQLKSQALLLAVNQSDIEAVVPFIHFIQEGGIAGGSYKYSKERILDEFLDSIISRVDGGLEILLEKGSFKQSSCNLCQYCEFNAMCKTGKRGSGGLLKPVIEKSKQLFK